MAGCGPEGLDHEPDNTTEDAIRGGTDDASTPSTNATVRIGNCTGTLVAPSVVMTAASCLADYDACTAEPSPTTWKALPSNLEIRFGHDMAGLRTYGVQSIVDNAGTHFTITSSEIPVGSVIAAGQPIQLRTSSGHYLFADRGGGGWAGSGSSTPGPFETFTFEKTGGVPGLIEHGQLVGIRGFNTHYLVSENNCTGVINANRLARGPWETFFLIPMNRLGYEGSNLRVGMTIVLYMTGQPGTADCVVGAKNQGDPSIYRATATHYARPGRDDVALLRLSAPVPASIAVPVAPLTRLPSAAVSDPRAFWRAQAGRIAGWGGTALPANIGGRTRQTAAVSDLDIGDCHDTGSNALCVRSGATPDTRVDSGDKGGPLYWGSSVVGVISGPGRGVRAYSTATFLAGGGQREETCSIHAPYPNVASWLETMLSLSGDCVAIEPFSSVVEAVSGGFRIRNATSNAVLEDGFTTLADAQRALAIMRHYGMGQKCFERRPAPILEYNLSGVVSPSGAWYPGGEDCIGFDPAALVVTHVGGSWMLQSYGSSLADLGTGELAARLAMGTLQRYRFSQMCFVGRPSAAWTYFRR